MRNTVFDYVGNLDTLLAVCIGALLATGGALVAEIIQDRTHRKRREREAARFVGDILMSFDRVLDFAFRSQTIGAPWGKTTLRLFKTAYREAQVYERNRERLFDIQDMELRSRIHTHFLTKTVPLEAMIENCTRLSVVQDLLDSGGKEANKDKLGLELERANLHEWLDTGLNVVRAAREKTPIICKSIEGLAKVKFDLFDTQAFGASVAPSSSEDPSSVV